MSLSRRTLVTGRMATAAAGALTGPALLEWATAWAQTVPWKPKRGAQLSMLRCKYFVQSEDEAFVAILHAFTKARSQSLASLWTTGAEANLPPEASGADYMLMWTKILEGRSGLGEDFDFMYFAGPSDFAKFFKLDGDRDMEKLEAAFDKRLTDDPGLKPAVDQNKISKKTFRNYYALRAWRSATARTMSGISVVSLTSAAGVQPTLGYRTN